MELCWKAALLYKGAFLKDSEQEGWVKEERERYHIMFRKLVEHMTEVLRTKKAYIQLEKLGPGFGGAGHVSPVGGLYRKQRHMKKGNCW